MVKARKQKAGKTDISDVRKRIDEIEAANNRLAQLDVSGSFTPQGRSVDSLPNADLGQSGADGSI